MTLPAGIRSLLFRGEVDQGHGTDRDLNRMRWNLYRRATWKRALRELQRLRGARLPEALAARLIAGWGDADRSVTPAYLGQCHALAMRATGTILEAGSGVTTIVLALGATGRPSSVVSFEQDARRRARVLRELTRLQARNADVRAGRVRSYGDFEWYDVDGRSLRRPIAAVISHGPTASSPRPEQWQKVFPDGLPDGCRVFTDAGKRSDS